MTISKQLVAPKISDLATAYWNIYDDQKRDYFGLRDFYCLVKMVYNYSASSGQPPTWPEVEMAVRRNFGGHNVEQQVKTFQDQFADSEDLQDG